MRFIWATCLTAVCLCVLAAVQVAEFAMTVVVMAFLMVVMSWL